MRGYRCATFALGLLLAACGIEDARDRVNHPGALRESFAVSEFFTPSGYMGDGETLGQLVGQVNQNCRKRPTGAKGDCYVYDYRSGAYGWAGVYWVHPANNWGSRRGRSIEGAKFHKVRLKVAADPPEALVNFVVGGIADPLLPNRDRVSAITSVRVGGNWTDVELDISGQDFDQVIGALAWSMAFPPDREGNDPARLYLDDLVWETAPSEAEALE